MIAPYPPAWLLIAVYFLYLGLATTASVPLFADIDWMHEGERMGTAQILLDGGLPFRDVYLPHGFFEEAIRPLLAFSIFGESLAADRLIGLFLEPLAYVAAAIYVWKLFPAPAWRVLGLIGFALYPLLILPRHILVFLTLALLAAWARARRDALVFWAGLVTGLATVFSTFDHAAFLLGAVVVFPIAITAERVLHNLGAAGRKTDAGLAVNSKFSEMALPLLGGLGLGVLPFLGYVVLTGTASTFAADFMSRAQADAYVFRHVWGHQSAPPFTGAYLIWYAIPALYLVMAATIMVCVYVRGDPHWTPLWPTLLFGVISYVYAIRAYTYWKLAVVSFPFVICFIYALYGAKMLSGEQRPVRERSPAPRTEVLLLGLSALSMVIVLAHSLTRDWNPKQIAPRFLFPALAVSILAAVILAAAERFSVGRWRDRLIVACPVAALVVAVCFYHDAKPQLLSAQLKKPRLLSDAARLVNEMADERLTREHPPYVQDETLRYLQGAARDKRPVIMLAPGAGIYYFLARLSPPDRFPEINMALAESWAEEVVADLERTKAELLVACDDQGRQMRGWPIRPILSAFIGANYADSGRRLSSQLLGHCPFSVWIYRATAGVSPSDKASGYADS